MGWADECRLRLCMGACMFGCHGGCEHAVPACAHPALAAMPAFQMLCMPVAVAMTVWWRQAGKPLLSAFMHWQPGLWCLASQAVGGRLHTLHGRRVCSRAEESSHQQPSALAPTIYIYISNCIYMGEGHGAVLLVHLLLPLSAHPGCPLLFRQKKLFTWMKRPFCLLAPS